MIFRVFWIVLGTISLALGIIGIAIPGLPTTPFILLTAFLYLKGSPRLHQWLLNHHIFGKYLRNWKRGITPKSVFVTICIMWGMVLLSLFTNIESQWAKRAVISAAIVGTAVQIYLLRKYYYAK